MKQFKCIVVGDSNVGKTSFLFACKTNSFYHDYVPTVCEDCHLMIKREETIFLDFIDTCKSDTVDVYENADLFLLCFSIVNQKSFDNIKKFWFPNVRKKNKHTPIILVGMKSDFRDKSIDKNKSYPKNIDPIPLSKCEELKNEIKAANYIECSSMLRSNLQEVLICCYDVIKNNVNHICHII